MNPILSVISFVLSLIIVGGSIEPTYIPQSQGEQINHYYYILSYNENTEQANWVYYKLSDEMLRSNVKRSGNFRNDPFVSTKSASTKDYTNTGFDRGHLCPAADMSFDSIAMYESFFMSNVSPQNPGFNRGIWKSLEGKVRDWVEIKKELIIVTGPIFNKTDQRIGQHNVCVPAYFYKILFAEKQNQMIAFVLPNSASSSSLDSFVSTVDSVEQITGIDFFSQLPDSYENKIESEIALSGWFVNSTAILPISHNDNNNALILLLLVIAILLIIIIFISRKRV